LPSTPPSLTSTRWRRQQQRLPVVAWAAGRRRGWQRRQEATAAAARSSCSSRRLRRGACRAGGLDTLRLLGAQRQRRQLWAQAGTSLLTAKGTICPTNRPQRPRYRAAFDHLRALRDALQPAADAFTASKAAQLAAFNAWCAERGLAPCDAASIQAFHAAAAAAASAAAMGTGGGGAQPGAPAEEPEDAEELDPAETFERLQMARCGGGRWGRGRLGGGWPIAATGDTGAAAAGSTHASRSWSPRSRHLAPQDQAGGPGQQRLSRRAQTDGGARRRRLRARRAGGRGARGLRRLDRLRRATVVAADCGTTGGTPFGPAKPIRCTVILWSARLL
jgi:hypothetical protein